MAAASSTSVGSWLDMGWTELSHSLLTLTYRVFAHLFLVLRQVWTHDGPQSETFGLAPNYECCTTNFNQGWPKLINQVVMSTEDGGAAVALLLPASAKLADGSTVVVETSYPFEDLVVVRCIPARGRTTTLPLYIRVPHWATQATINGTAVPAGTMAKRSCGAGQPTAFILDLSPEVLVEEWAGDRHGGVATNPVRLPPPMLLVPPC